MIINNEYIPHESPRATYFINKRLDSTSFVSNFNPILGPERSDLEARPLLTFGLCARPKTGKTSIAHAFMNQWETIREQESPSELRPQGIFIIADSNAPYRFFHYDKKTDPKEDVPPLALDDSFKDVSIGLEIVENVGHKFKGEEYGTDVCHFAMKLSHYSADREEVRVDFYCEDADFIRPDVRACLLAAGQSFRSEMHFDCE